MMKGKNLQPRLLYPARLSFRFEGESKTFTDNIGSPQYIRQQLTSVKGQIDNNTIIVGDTYSNGQIIQTENK